MRPLALFLAVAPLYAQSVILAPEASPSTAEPAITIVTLTGSGFPAGPVAKARIHFTPAAGGPTTSTHPDGTQTLFGTTNRITFKLPSSISVTAPTAYQIAVDGTSKSGIAFSSANTAAITVNPAAQISSLTPSLANPSLTLQVTIAGLYTNFLPGVTQASFGPGISVGGAPAGQPGPVTVTSPTTAVAQLAIASSAATGTQNVSIVTGNESVPATFAVGPAIPIVNVDVTTTAAITPGVSGFNDEALNDGIEYWDPKYLAVVQPLKPGWLRFPGGTPGMAFDWQSGHFDKSWVRSLRNRVGLYANSAMTVSSFLSQAKGGVYLSDFASFTKSLGAWPIICLNTYTDNNPGTVSKMVAAAQSYGLNVHEWELGNEPWAYPKIYKTSKQYAAAVYKPYFHDLLAADPTALGGVAYQGQFSGNPSTYKAWDNGLTAYKPSYWNAVSVHIYPVHAGNLTDTQEEQSLNGILAHGSLEYLSSYLFPLIGDSTPVFITELNDGHSADNSFKAYLYNGIFLSEYTARMSTSPNVKAIGITNLFEGNESGKVHGVADQMGMLRAPDDYERYLIQQVQQNPTYSTDTATDPNTQYQFYFSAPGLAMEIVNQAINNSSHIWPTTVTDGPTVPIIGYDNQPVPAIYAQAYAGDNGVHYVVLTNKSGSSVPLALTTNGALLQQTVQISYISNPDPTTQNTPTAQTTIQIVETQSANPITVGPYAVMRIEW